MSTNDLNLISNYKKIIGLQNILSSSSGVTFIGISTINSSLYISNNTIINNNLTLNSSLNVSNNTNIIQNLTTLSLINNNLLSNNISVNSNLLINGNNIISNNINISNISIITNSSTILSSLNVNDTVNIQNTLYLNNINLSTINAANINIGNPYSIIKINGTTISLLSNNLEVVDKYISLNYNTSSLGPIDIGNNCGLLISGISGDGFLRTNTTSTLFEMKAPLNNLNYPVILDSNNNLNITGTTLIYGNTTINSSLNISNNSIFNISLINNNLFISTFANLQNITLLSSLYISTFSIINNNTTINNNLYVSGSTNINSSITMLSNLVANNYYCNNVSLLSDLIISNNSILGQSTILSNINCLSNNILTNVSINSNLTISAYTNLYNTTINSQLFILNNSTFNNNSTINSSLFCKENTIIKGNVNLGSTINNNITINSWIITPLLPEFMDNLSATLGGIPILGLYRTGDIVKIRAPYIIPTDLYFWIDATNLNSITKDVNNNITSIIDISGNNIVMGNYVSRPKYKINGINNLPIIDLTNSSSMKSNNNYLNSLNVTIAVVTTFFQNTNWGCIWGHFSNSNTDITLEYNNNVAGYIHFQTNNDNSTCQIQYLPGVPVIFIGVLSNGISRYFKMINLNTGQEVYVTATNSLSMTLTNCPIRLGSSALTNELALCYIGEVLYWQRVLNSTDIYNVSQYLFNKWGLITATLSYIAPPITLSLIGPAQNYILLNDTYIESGITINSITDPNLTPIITGSYDLTILGSYILTYTVNNGFNIMSITRTINVVSSIPFVSYDTTNGNLQINSGLNFNSLNNADWTIECWLYMSNNNASTIIFDFRQPNQVYIPVNHFWCGIDSYKPYIQAMGQGTTGTSINYTISLNTWAHVTWMRNNNKLYTFINGFASPGESIPSYMNILSGLNYIVFGCPADWINNNGTNYHFMGQICQPLITKGAKYSITGFIPVWNLSPISYSNILFWMINGTDSISNQQIILNRNIVKTTLNTSPIFPVIILNGSSNIYLSYNSNNYYDLGVSISDVLQRNFIPYISSITDIFNNQLLPSPLNSLNTNIISNTIINTTNTLSFNTIKNSLSLVNNGTPQYLTRTFSNNSTKWTISFWCYLDNTACAILTSSNGSALLYNYGGSNFRTWMINNTGLLQLSFLSAPTIQTWTHIVYIYDSTQIIPTNRFLCYFNNILQINISNGYNATGANINLNQILDEFINPTQFWIGNRISLDSQVNGYLSQFIFVDNLALTPNYFGYTLNNTWIAKTYTGTFGPNGWYLDFSNPNNPGLDASGNNNNWVSTNILPRYIIKYNICPQICLTNTNIVTTNANTVPLYSYTLTYTCNNTLATRIINILNYNITNLSYVSILYNTTNIITTYNRAYLWCDNFTFSNNNMYGGIYAAWAINPKVLGWMNFSSPWSIILRGKYVSIGNYQRLVWDYDPNVNGWIIGIDGGNGIISPSIYCQLQDSATSVTMYGNTTSNGNSLNGSPWTMMLSGFYLIFRRDSNGYLYFTMTDINQKMYYNFVMNTPYSNYYNQTPIYIQQMVNYQWEKGILISNNTTLSINDWIATYGN